MNKAEKDAKPQTLRRRDFVLSLIGGVLIIATVFLAFAPETLWRRSSIAPAVERKAGPTFVLPDLDGKAWLLSEQRGKVVLVNYWATWCPPCRKETPDLVRLANAYKTKGLEVVGISLDEDVSVIRPFVDEFKIPYPILVPDNIASLPQQILGLPTSVLYDQEGRLAKIYTGAVTESVLKADVESLLNEP